MRTQALLMLIAVTIIAIGATAHAGSQTPAELAGMVRVYTVSPDGDDGGPGTAMKPFRTISRAARVLLPGEAVLVRAGVYRERVSPARGGESGKPIVYLAEPGHRVIIKGSEVWQPDWSLVQPRIYAAKPDDAMFSDDAYFDSANPLKVTCTATPWSRDGRVEYEYFSGGKKPEPAFAAKCDRSLAYTLGQVFVDGRMYKQMPFRKEMEAEGGSWFYDQAAGAVMVHFADDLAPARHQVELTTRRRIFAPHLRGLGYIHVIGFVMEHCGNQYPRDFWSVRENAQAGALGTRAGHHWLIRDNVIRWTNGIALDIGAEGPDSERANPVRNGLLKSGHHVIENNWFADNGAGGIAGYVPSDVRITGNVFERNTNLRFKGKKRYESAALKLHTPDRSVVAGNLFLDNYSNGIWFDGGFGKGARVTGNVIIGNKESEHGMFVEMGVYPADTGSFDNNIVIGNKNAFYCHDGSGVTAKNNLLANSADYGIQVRQVGPRCNTKNHAFFDNLVIGNAADAVINYPAELGGNIRLDRNLYSAGSFRVSKYSKYDPGWTDAQFAEMITTDLGKSATVAAGCVALTFDEWRTFWARHSADSDAHSVVEPAATVAVDPATLELTLVLPRVEMTGPFRDLKPGVNKILLWDGIKPIGK